MALEFHCPEDWEGIAALLAEADLEEGEIRWEGGEAVLALKTHRPPEGQPKSGGLFRKRSAQWRPCRLVLRRVRRMRVWEEYDPPPENPPLVRAEPAEGGFRVRVSSPRGLRAEVELTALDGRLED